MNYPLTYGAHATNHFTKRRAHTKAQFLLPFLKETDTLLDCGCGPGSITVDFAEILKQGEVFGIDLDAHQFDWAIEEAEKRKLSNVHFQKANVYSLPFPDETFDVVFCHAMLWTVPDPLIALLEMKRVLKKGGILAAREVDYTPHISNEFLPPLLLKAKEFQIQGLLACGSHCFLGRELRPLFEKGGLSDIQTSFKTDRFSQPEEISSLVAYYLKNWTDSPWVSKLRLLKLVSEKEIDEIKGAWELFGKSEKPQLTGTFGEALGFKP